MFDVTKNKPILFLASIAFISIIYCYWLYRGFHPSTDDAYVQANVVNIAAQIPGPIATVTVQNHQTVKKGQLLFTIDPTPFQLEVDSAQAQLKLSDQNAAAAESAVQVANANVARLQAELTNTQKNTQRILTLSQHGIMSKASGDNALTQQSVTQASLAAAQNQLKEAQQQLGDIGVQNAQVQAATARLAKARLDLAHTQIFAPADGILVNFSLRPGTMIEAGTPLFTLVENKTWWVDANFKETDLKQLHPGETATIVLDIYPDHTFKGIVQGINAGSGAAFSLLPPENATGNWVKVIQRFPVRVDIQNPDPRYPLRIGASSTVTVNAWR